MNNDQYKESDELIRKFNLSQHRLTRNRLILVTCFNIICFITILLSLVYYRYALVTMQIVVHDMQDQLKKTNKIFWFNFLYIKQDKERQSFSQASSDICMDDKQCIQKISQIAFTGYCSFTSFVIGMALQIYDFYKVFLHLSMCNVDVDLKDNFRRMFTVLSYICGIVISIIGLQFIDVQYQLGFSFWVTLVATICFIGLLSYQHISVKIMMKQSLILDLIQNQMKYHKTLTDLGDNKKNNENSSKLTEKIKQGTFNSDFNEKQLKNIQNIGKLGSVNSGDLDQPSYTL